MSINFASNYGARRTRCGQLRCMLLGQSVYISGTVWRRSYADCCVTFTLFILFTSLATKPVSDLRQAADFVNNVILRRSSHCAGVSLLVIDRCSGRVMQSVDGVFVCVFGR